MIAVCNHSQSPFSAQMLCKIASLDVNGRPTQGFPFYTYMSDGSNRRENITDWTLGKFQRHYRNDSITKWDIFYYVYAILHHPTYRQQYALDLKKRIPRIPFTSKFQSLVDAGSQLAELHAYYEDQQEYLLEVIEDSEAEVNWRVEKMMLSEDKSSLKYNDFLTLTEIPKETFEYRIGNRAALNWVIDQHQVTRDEEGEIIEDPNQIDDEQYILRLIRKVITVSIKTVEIIRELFRFCVSGDNQPFSLERTTRLCQLHPNFLMSYSRTITNPKTCSVKTGCFSN